MEGLKIKTINKDLNEIDEILSEVNSNNNVLYRRFFIKITIGNEVMYEEYNSGLLLENYNTLILLRNNLGINNNKFQDKIIEHNVGYNVITFSNNEYDIEQKHPLTIVTDLDDFNEIIKNKEYITNFDIFPAVTAKTEIGFIYSNLIEDEQVLYSWKNKGVVFINDGLYVIGNNKDKNVLRELYNRVKDKKINYSIDMCDEVEVNEKRKQLIK